MPEKYQATKNISEAPSAKRSSGFIVKKIRLFIRPRNLVVT